jgi:hypothetical protein
LQQEYDLQVDRGYPLKDLRHDQASTLVSPAIRERRCWVETPKTGRQDNQEEAARDEMVVEHHYKGRAM